ncbi:MAG: YcxB family protein [Clostridia bacterium]|nr:YcxB family protein [Clostridia bacterium]
MEQRPVCQCSVLLTKEEFTAFREENWRAEHSLAALIGGGALLLLGAGGWLASGQLALSPLLTGSMAALGLLWIAQDRILRPLLVRSRAAAAFDRQPEWSGSAQYVFYPDRVQLRTARETGEIPLSALTAWRESKTMLALFFGRELTVLLPRRLLTPQEQNDLIEVLRAL